MALPAEVRHDVDGYLGAVDDRWHAVITAAMALRADQRSPLSRSVEALHREAAEVSAQLIEDAHRLLDR